MRRERSIFVRRLRSVISGNQPSKVDNAIRLFQALREQAAFSSIPVELYEGGVINSLLELCQQHFIGLDLFVARIGSTV